MSSEDNCGASGDGAEGCGYRMESGQDLIEMKERRVGGQFPQYYCVEASWEVANKQGGIYTVLRSKVGFNTCPLLSLPLLLQLHTAAIHLSGGGRCAGVRRALPAAGAAHRRPRARGGAAGAAGLHRAGPHHCRLPSSGVAGSGRAVAGGGQSHRPPAGHPVCRSQVG